MFGSEFNKELLISFLNAMFHGEQNVQDVTYLNSEQLGDRVDARRAIFDVYCENDKGEKLIVEMQNVYHEFFKDRTIYYSMFPIREQAQRGGDWDFHLNPVYTIGLLNFNFAEGLQNAKRWHHEVKLMEVDTHEVFYDKLTYIYVEIPKFDNQERKQYEDSVNAYRDIVNAIRTAEKKKFAEGMAKGKAEGIAEGMAKGEKAAKVKIAANLLSLGVPMETIIQASGLSEEEIKNMMQ